MDQSGTVNRRTLVRALLALFVLSLAAMAAADQGLKGPAAPLGIISFQLCGLRGSCEALLAQWGEHGRLLAMLSLGVDYLFLLTYPLLVSLGLLALLDRVPEALRAVTQGFAGAVLASGVADAVENYVLIRILLGHSGVESAGIASAFAIVKFAVLYAAAGWLLFVWGSYRRRTART